MEKGIKWPAGHGYSTDEWMIKPNLNLTNKINQYVQKIKRRKVCLKDFFNNYTQ